MDPEETSIRGEQSPDVDRLQTLANVDREATEPEPVEVSDIMREEHVYFVHGILNVESPAHGTLLRSDVDFRQKLDIALFLHPNLACSSLSEKDTVDSMWSKMGILLNGGQITGVAAGDNVTRARSLRHRIREGKSMDVPTKEAIIAAIQKVRLDTDSSIQRGHNEINISNSFIAGFYVSLDPSHLDFSLGVLPSHPQVYSWVERELHMPVYVHTGNTFSLGRFNRETYLYEPIPGSTVTPEELADTPSYSPGEEITKAQIDSLKEYPPFVEFTRGLKELSCAHSYAFGKDFYMTLKEDETVPRNNSSVRLNLGRYNQRGSVWFFSDNPFNDYIEGVAGDIERKKTDIDLYATDKRDYAIPGLTEEIRNLAYHLYGFADQAESLGDTALAERARALAQTAVSEEDARELVKRRIGKDGDIRMTDEDIAELHTSPAL